MMWGSHDWLVFKKNTELRWVKREGKEDGKSVKAVEGWGGGGNLIEIPICWSYCLKNGNVLGLIWAASFRKT